MDPNMLRSTVESLADQEVEAAASIAHESVPTGNYSKERINKLVADINSFKSLMGDDTPLTFKATESIKDDELPMEIVNELLGLNQAFSTYLAAEPDEADVVSPIDVKSMIGNGDLALVSKMLQNLQKDKTFAKFLRSDVKPSEPVPEPAGVEAPSVTPPPNAMPADLDPAVMAELDMLTSL